MSLLEGLQRHWLVWSNEHGAFWRPDSMGYTSDIKQAGRYTQGQARRCCDSGKLDPDGKPEEVMMLAPEAVDAAIKSLPDDPALLKAEVERLRTRYEKPGQRCNSGHENVLPVSLWDCPTCTEQTRELLKEMVSQMEGFAMLNCECWEDSEHEAGRAVETHEPPMTCPEDNHGEECECVPCCARRVIAKYRKGSRR